MNKPMDHVGKHLENMRESAVKPNALPEPSNSLQANSGAGESQDDIMILKLAFVYASCYLPLGGSNWG